MAERANRRLAAVVVADVAGYTRLMAADEEGTLARLKVLRTELIDPRDWLLRINPATNLPLIDGLRLAGLPE